MKFLHEFNIYLAWAVALFCLILNQRLLRMNARLLKQPPRGKSYIRMEDGTSHAVIYWDHRSGHCDVWPVFVPDGIAELEAQKAKEFYSCPVTITIHNHKGESPGL